MVSDPPIPAMPDTCALAGVGNDENSAGKPASSVLTENVPVRLRIPPIIEPSLLVYEDLDATILRCTHTGTGRHQQMCLAKILRHDRLRWQHRGNCRYVWRRGSARAMRNR